MAIDSLIVSSTSISVNSVACRLPHRMVLKNYEHNMYVSYAQATMGRSWSKFRYLLTYFSGAATQAGSQPPTPENVIDLVLALFLASRRFGVRTGKIPMESTDLQALNLFRRNLAITYLLIYLYASHALSIANILALTSSNAENVTNSERKSILRSTGCFVRTTDERSSLRKR